VTSVLNDAPGTFPKGTTIVTWTVTDKSGKTATATQAVTVVDNQPPTITAPANLPDVPTDPGLCSAANVNLGAPTTADNCGVASVVNDAPATFPKGTTTVTWIVTDTSGKTATATQTVTVQDHEKPIVPALPTVTGSCGENLVLPVPGGPGTAFVVTDNCGGPITVTPNTPQVLSSVGTNVVQWTFTDASGNSTTVYQTGIVARLGFTGFYSPIGTVSNTCSTAVSANWGRTIPIKFDFYCGTTKITSGPAPVVTIQKMKNCQPYGAPLIVNAVYQNYWHYNWNTDGCGKDEIYKFTITLPDGQKPYVFVKAK
jgi:hypothetical protein